MNAELDLARNLEEVGASYHRVHLGFIQRKPCAISQ